MYSLQALLGYRFESLPAKILAIGANADGRIADMRLVTGHRAEAPLDASHDWRVGETVEVLLKERRDGQRFGLAVRKALQLPR